MIKKKKVCQTNINKRFPNKSLRILYIVNVYERCIYEPLLKQICDLTWQDEHSAPFSWETKVSNPSLPNRVRWNSASSPVASTDESSFWKISAERSRLEGEKAEFQSLTPSQIKSLEKGEKPLPSYLRSESGARESEYVPPSRPVQQRITKPHAPPPPVPISVTPVAISVTPTPPAPVSSSEEGWERAQSTLPSVSTMGDVFSPGLVTRSSSQSNSTVKDAKAESSPTSSPTFSQFNTSSSILKTGFDFLDNW
uniref:DUF4706 domain-containing protein n=1 Tax=Sinocyclocheilus grahami TaxID=75366 RepID=A0A672NVU8_SINGR